MVTDKFAPSAPGTAAKPRRMASRDSTFLRASLHREDGTILPGLRVRNLSPGGLMVETAEVFEPGETVKIELRNIGLVPSQVAWAIDERVGIAFDREIKPEAVRSAPPRSPGTTMQLMRPGATQSRRPGLKIG